jgi:hypothetical protein
MFAAIRRASSLLSNLAVERRSTAWLFFETLENKAYAHRRKVDEKRKEQSCHGYSIGV